MGITGLSLQLPSATLPPLRDLTVLTAAQIDEALRNLHRLFCPLPTSLDFQRNRKSLLEVADSGYVSDTDADDKPPPEPATLPDDFERNVAVRWLTGFVGRAHELATDEAALERLVDEACSVLAHLTRENGTQTVTDGRGHNLGMTRIFTFSSGNAHPAWSFQVELNDTPMQTGEDHTDVGLQTWGASMALSDIISRNPHEFGFSQARLDPPCRIVELGAGTGLVSLFLSRLIPHVTATAAGKPSIIATDNHPTVLLNLEANINAHREKSPAAVPVEACHLDWSAPSRRQPPLDVPADILIAADVTYAPEHAAWLLGCAAALLADQGVFWLMVSERPNGKFAGIRDTVEAAFGEQSGECTRPNGKRLSISSVRRVDKRREFGRADEVGYKLFEITWV